MTVEVLHPPVAGVRGGDNANSLVLRLTALGRRVVLPGDVEGEGMDRVLATRSPGVDVLLAAHHGSPRSRPREFVAWCRPRRVLISGGGSAKSEQVRAEFASGGASVWETHRDGAVRCDLFASRVVVRAYRTRPW